MSCIAGHFLLQTSPLTFIGNKYAGVETQFTCMSLGDDLLKKINKKFDPSTKVAMRYRSYDLLLITDKEGNAIQLFMGKENEQGVIKGDRYARTLKYDREGHLIKDHWEEKAKLPENDMTVEWLITRPAK